MAFRTFLASRNIEFSLRRYGIDALNFMALGLFSSLIIGLILKTVGGWLDWPLTCGRFFSAASTELRRAEMRTPARSSNARPEPSGWAMMAASTWIGSM